MAADNMFHVYLRSYKEESSLERPPSSILESPRPSDATPASEREGESAVTLESLRPWPVRACPRP
jgi:hypothetical protein